MHSPKKLYIGVLIGILFSGMCSAQQTNTEIWLFRLKKNKNTYVPENGINITANPLYDNQPFFLPDNKTILFSSQRDSSKQTDIYSYSINKKTINRILETNESEYSPMLVPNSSTFSCVVVEKDSTQRIWQYELFKDSKKNLKGKFKSIICEGIDSIGYYRFLNSDTLIYYKLTSPHSLRVVSLSTGVDNWICEHPSRSMLKDQNQGFYYSIITESNHELRHYDIRKKKSQKITELEKDNLDFQFVNALGILKSQGNALWIYNSQQKRWNEWFRFTNPGIGKITRFVFSSDMKYLAVVGNN